MITQLHRITLRALLLVLSFASNAFAEKATETVPPARAAQQVSSEGFSTWDLQFLYGTTFHEPGFNENIAKKTVTLENSAGWKWGSSYFFVDYLRSDAVEEHATEFYGEWYPSASIGKITGKEFCLGPLKDVLITMGFNAGSKNTGASSFVYLPGITIDLKLPAFQFFSIGTYAYIDEGRFEGESNGCHATTYQITPSWSLPFKIGFALFRFDGFIDFIGHHGECSSQIVAQPTIKLDLGGSLGKKPNKLFAGLEWGYWKNKYGISKLDQTAPQVVVMWVF